MKAIREGDLYFLNSPFHIKPYDDTGAVQEKRLSYLLGTVSSRPAVVIRAPAAWDKFNTVTVLPALSKGYPAMIFQLQDRYGRLTEAAYPFVPHNPHTIPVSRLGHYIGSLEEHELEKLLYAFRWIHSPDYQRDPRTYPVPSMYATALSEKIPVQRSWRYNRDARSDIDITLDKRTMTVQSNTNPELNGFDIGSPLRQCGVIPQEADDAMSDETDFIATDRPLPDAESTKNELITEQLEAKEIPTDSAPINALMKAMSVVEDSPRVPLRNKRFPESMFDTETLERVAGRFTLSDAYFHDEITKRDPNVLNESELAEIRGGLSDFSYQNLLDIYKRMTPLDATFLAVRLPKIVMADLLGLKSYEATVLKRLCKTLANMDEDEYERRLYAPAESAVEADEATAESESAQSTLSRAEVREICAAIRPYMNDKRIKEMPKPIALQFLKLSMGQVKRIWTGPNFKTCYAEARALYKTAKEIEETLVKAAGMNNT